MDEHLVEYALGSLDPVTYARVDAYVKSSPHARLTLDLIEQALSPLAADSSAVEPPPDLARNTLALIVEHHRLLPAAPPSLPSQSDSSQRRWFRWPDGLVAALLLILVGGLSFPALARQWQAYQRAACANSLRQLHNGLVAYADEHDGAFPRVESSGPRAAAGIFVPLLADAGLITGVRVACPTSGKSQQSRKTVSALEKLHMADPARYQDAVRDLAGGYAYTLGYLEAGRLNSLRTDSGDDLPLLADGSPDGGNSSNHGGAGQNVLYVGGNVRWCTQPTVGIDGDNIFLNHHRRVQAGVCRSDSVLGTGDARPSPMD